MGNDPAFPADRAGERRSPRVIVFAALDWECRPVLRALRRVRRVAAQRLPMWRGEAACGAVWVVKTGVGPARAHAAAAQLDLGGCALIVSTGCAGGLAPAMRAGDLVLASALRDAAGLHATDAAVRARLATLTAGAGLPLREGLVACSATVLASPTAKRAAAASGALAVEMEGGPIAAAAHRARRPFVSVRAVIDGADDDLGLLTRIGDPDTGQIRPLVLLGHLARRPGAVAQLLAMRRAQVAARDSLRTLFSLWLAQDQP